MKYLFGGDGIISGGVSFLVGSGAFVLARVVVVLFGLVHFGENLDPGLLRFFEVVLHLLLLLQHHHRLAVRKEKSVPFRRFFGAFCAIVERSKKVVWGFFLKILVGSSLNRWSREYLGNRPCYCAILWGLLQVVRFHFKGFFQVITGNYRY